MQNLQIIYFKVIKMMKRFSFRQQTIFGFIDAAETEISLVSSRVLLKRCWVQQTQLCISETKRQVCFSFKCFQVTIIETRDYSSGETRPKCVETETRRDYNTLRPNETRPKLIGSNRNETRLTSTLVSILLAATLFEITSYVSI